MVLRVKKVRLIGIPPDRKNELSMVWRWLDLLLERSSRYILGIDEERVRYSLGFLQIDEVVEHLVN